jgi:hypothetical protein
MSRSGYKRPGSPTTWRWLYAGMVLTVVSLIVLIVGAGPFVKAGFLVAACVCYLVGSYRLLHGELPRRS